MFLRHERFLELILYQSDAFIALPGGFGTMEELLEVITWSQLNVHSKPIILLNTKNYYGLFSQWIDHCIQGKWHAHYSNFNQKSLLIQCFDRKIH